MASAASREQPVIDNKPKHGLCTTLPPELLQMVVNQVDNHRALFALSRTCWALHRLCLPLLVDRDARGHRVALHWACVNGRTEMAKKMLAAGAHTKMFGRWVLSRKFSTPVRYWGPDEVLLRTREALLPPAYESREVESYSLGIQNIRLPLDIAVAWRHVDIVRALVAEGANTLFRAKDRITSHCTVYDRFDAADWALARNPLVPDSLLPQEAIKVAEILRIIINNRKRTLKDYLTTFCWQWLRGWWKESYAEETYMLEIIRVLIELGANPENLLTRPTQDLLREKVVEDSIEWDELDRSNSPSLLEWVCEHCHGTPRNLELLEVLLESKAVDINKPNRTKHTMLHSAVERRHADVVKFLLYKGADPNLVRNPTRDTPLHLLGKIVHNPGAPGPPGEDVEIAKQLILSGAIPSIRDRLGHLPVDAANMTENWGVAAFLMSVHIAKGFAERHVFHEKKAWDDLEWRKFVRVVVELWPGVRVVEDMPMDEE